MQQMPLLTVVTTLAAVSVAVTCKADTVAFMQPQADMQAGRTTCTPKCGRIHHQLPGGRNRSRRSTGLDKSRCSSLAAVLMLSEGTSVLSRDCCCFNRTRLYGHGMVARRKWKVPSSEKDVHLPGLTSCGVGA